MTPCSSSILFIFEKEIRLCFVASWEGEEGRWEWCALEGFVARLFIMADFGQTYFGQSDFGQFFDRLWPILGLTDFGQTDFGQHLCFRVLTDFGQTDFGQFLCFSVLAKFC